VTITAIPTADLEPSQVSGQTYVTRRRPTYIDAAVLLSLMTGLTLLVPSYLIVPGMTDLARPGLIVGFVLFCWWLLVHFTLHLVMTGPQPIRWALLAYIAAALASYAVGFLRGLTTIEANGADRAMLFALSFAGVVLAAADGVPNWLRLRGVVKVLVTCAAIVGFIALLQYMLALDITQYLIFPGLEAKGWAPGFEVRGAGIRVAGTMTHYIEMAAALAMTLPFAIHFACFGRRPRYRRLALMAAALIAAGIATTISRTGMLAIALMFVVMIPVWTWRMRYNILTMSAGLGAVLTVMNPGLVSTLLGLFDDPESNPAFTVRAERYPLAFSYFEQRPWLGRGTGTYLWPQYQILDNQWLATLISNGIFGVATLAGLHITGIVLAGLAWRRSTTLEDRHLCAALIATQVIAIAVAGTFDALSFSTYTMVLALTVGLCGTMWRLTHPARKVRTSTTRWFLDSTATG